MQVDIDVALSVVGSVLALLYGLYGRAIAAENRLLKEQVESLQKVHTDDMRRIESNNEDIWQEIKCQRESLAQNREAVIKLNGSIERLNENNARLSTVLDRIELSLNSKTSREECTAFRKDYVSRTLIDSVPGGKRRTDPPEYT